ncbi:MAG: serine--tRNA ligase [Chloroflexi bacterium]|nr:serine--tRNA ligase [Chloroflexota bacterium]MXW28529.1 serine--tRNA ligase [Chloroflexota bacterium]MYC48644.1 serine--tRNA ligase [Chloroflexota bacterium]
MYSLRFLRENAESVRAGVIAKGHPAESLDLVLELDRRRRGILVELEHKRHEVRSTSRSIGTVKDKSERDVLIARTRAASEALKPLEDSIAKVADELDAALLDLPNTPHETTPLGSDASGNIPVADGGHVPDFEFEPRNHVDLAENLGLIDFARSAKLSGSGFWLHFGASARLQRALSNWMLDLQTREHGYTEVYPPALVRGSALVGTGQLPKFADDQYKIASEDLWLIPTAEVPLTNIYADEIIAEETLPLKFAALTPCFRREAGAAGTDTRGLLRVHQFDKVELVRITSPETGYSELEETLEHALAPVKLLGLPYRVIELCSGDLSLASAKTYDIELWAPGTGRWLEVSSVSCFGEFQARRMNLRCRSGGKGQVRHPYTINGSGLALPRLTVAIMENFQQADGSIRLPELLGERLGQAEITTAG